MASDDTDDSDEPQWLLAELCAACLRVTILNKPQSGIDTLQPYVRQRIEEAADILDDCFTRLRAVSDALAIPEQEEEDCDGHDD